MGSLVVGWWWYVTPSGEDVPLVTERHDDQQRARDPVLVGSSRVERDKPTGLPNRGVESWPAEGMPVHVVDDKSDVPVAHAAVHVWTYADQLAASDEVSTLDLSTRIRRHGHIYVANANGELVIPEPVVASWIWAKSGEAEAVLHVPAQSARPAVLRLRVLRGGVIRVRDSTGAGVAGVPVLLGLPSAAGLMVVWEGETSAPAGAAVVRDLESAIRAHTGRGIKDTVGPLLVGTRIPFEPPVLVTLSSVEIPAEGVDLLLPAHRGLVIRILRPDGSLYAAPALVTVQSSMIGSDSGNGPPRRHQQIEMSTETGEVLLPRVGVAVPLSVGVKDASGCFQPVTLTMTIPEEGALPFAVDLPLGELRPCLLVRLVREDGAAIANGQVAVFAQRGDLIEHLPVNGLLATDSAGLMRIALRQSLPPHVGGALHLSAKTLDGDRSVTGLATLPIHGPLGPAPTDLGTVTLRPMPHALEGTIADDEGAPVPNAKVRLVTPVEGFSGIAFETWTSADGSFVLLAPEGTARIDVAVEHPDFQRTQENHAFGSTGVSFVLFRTPVLRGSVLVDPDIDWRRLKFHLASGGDGAMRPLPVTWESPRHFLLRLDTTDPIDLAVAMQGSSHALTTIRGLYPGGKGEGEDEGARIDLRGVIRRNIVRIVDDHEVPIEGARVSFREEGEDAVRGTSTTDGTGTVVYYCRATDQIVVEASAAGYAPVTQRLSPMATDTETIRFVSRLYDLTFTSPLAFSHDLTEVMLLPTVQSASSGKVQSPHERQSGALLFSRFRAIPGRTWSISFQVASPGEYQITFDLAQYVLPESGALRELRRVRLGGVAPSRITVDDRIGVQVFPFEIPVGEIERASARIR
ncbi:MAG: carboxypeptidase-like regulatory domain-containing protein [Planctomycetota bacterium]